MKQILILVVPLLFQLSAIAQERTENDQASAKIVTILMGNLDNFRTRDSDGRYFYSDEHLLNGLKSFMNRLKRRGVSIKLVEHALAKDLKSALESTARAVIWIGHSWKEGGLVDAEGVVDGEITRIPQETFDQFRIEANSPVFFPMACLTKPKVLDFYQLPMEKVQYMRRPSGEACLLDFETVFTYVNENFDRVFGLLNLKDQMPAKGDCGKDLSAARGN